MIYADNAATTRLAPEVFEAMKPFLLESFANPSQPYSFSRNNKKAIKEARELIATCIGADPDEIYFTSCGTESDNWAIKMGVGFGESIVTSVIEHHAILNSCRTMERFGHKVIYVPVDKVGVVDLEWLKNSFRDNTRLVSVMFANNEIGTIQPVSRIAEIAHEHGCLFHTDAVQAVGHIPINVHASNIDMLSASAHKFNGPKGIGFLYIRNGVQVQPYIDGGSQEKGKRAGTENVAFIVGMAKALQINLSQMKESTEWLNKLEKQLIDELLEANIDFIHNGSECRIPGNVSLSFKGFQGEALMHRLDLMGICVSTGSACDSINTQISHVINEIHVPEDYAKGTIRISLGKDNTIEEVRTIGNALRRIICGYDPIHFPSH